ncbi:hypothetical protein [Aureibacillus halotolerans]|uniref:Lipoprotein n=1 Tax=Aureibacillus halotolerans TaxID=1508390 RepID=A0A4R6UAV7_9BACI|nr:hypothetical protein [Aureibacillus halotolerans]TDQ43006.1 hypothetical protein EV213_101438 [Aureibacillus halotolerans]
MKRIGLFLLFSGLMVGCGQANHESQRATSSEVNEQPAGIEADLIPFKFQKAISDADLIAEVIIKEKKEEVDVKPLPYTVFSAEVNNIYKNPSTNQNVSTITLKQQGNSEWTVNHLELFKPGETYILFLKETKGSKSDYWIIGEATGMFKVIDDDTIVKMLGPSEEFNTIEVETKNKNPYINHGSQVLDKNEFIRKINES